MERKKGGNLICKRPEVIIEARYSLNKRQNDIIDMVFATIEDDSKLEYEIDLAKYGKLYNIKDRSNVYRDLKKAVRSFEGKGFSISQKISTNKRSKGEDRIFFVWFSRIAYLDGESKIFVGIDPMLKELMLSAKKSCFYQIKYPLNFHNIYSKRIYYYLKSFENSNKDGTGWRIDNLNELREKLECPKTYRRYADFKRFVLKPANEEINSNSDIRFEIEEIKTKNRVTAIKFLINNNNQVRDEIAITAETMNADNANSEIERLKVKIEKITNGSISTDFLNELLNRYGKQRIEEKINLYPALTNNKNIQNTMGFFISSIVNDYKVVNQKGTTNNGMIKQLDAYKFQQRHYTEEELDSLFDDLENE